MAGDRNSPDVGERIEWQVDQVRQAVFVLVAVVVLAVIVVGVAVAYA
jgi:hypothetical protein